MTSALSDVQQGQACESTQELSQKKGWAGFASAGLSRKLRPRAETFHSASSGRKSPKALRHGVSCGVCSGFEVTVGSREDADVSSPV